MAKAARAAAETPLLPDEIVFWEILVLLPPKYLLRCRSVCRAWHHVTSTNDFLQAHHLRQPSLPIFCRFEYGIDDHTIVAFDHRVAAGAQLQPVVRLRKNHSVEASCDGLLILSSFGTLGDRFCVCNPATREHAPLPEAWGSRLLGMYLHRPTSEYRLLLSQRSSHNRVLGDPLPFGILALGSDQPLRYIRETETVPAARFEAPVLAHDNMHWYQVQHPKETERVLVFDTISESFRKMRPPVVPSPTTKSRIFETEGTLGICGYNNAMKTVDTWALHNYEDEVWEHKYRVELPVAGMWGLFGSWDGDCYVSVVSVDGKVLLLVRHKMLIYYIDMSGELVVSFRHDSQQCYSCEIRLKQTLVPHKFFWEQEGYVATMSPFA